MTDGIAATPSPLLSAGRRSRLTFSIAAAAVGGAFLLSTCGPGVLTLGAINGPTQEVPGGDPRRAPAEMSRYGCIACHVVPGVVGARGQVGPSLAGVATRSIIAGRLSNTPDNLIRWIRDPQGVTPGTVMPNMGVTEADARDIAAYLYTLR